MTIPLPFRRTHDLILYHTIIWFRLFDNYLFITEIVGILWYALDADNSFHIGFQAIMDTLMSFLKHRY